VKRDQILAGARVVFLRDGFAAASTDAIAAEARVSKRTLYAYYPTKEELFAETLRALTTEAPGTRILETVRKLEPGSREELRAALVELAGKLSAVLMQPDYLALLRVIVAEAPRLGGLFSSTVPERGLAEGAAMIQRATRHGVVREEVDPEVATRMLVGTLLTYAFLDGLLRPGEAPRPPSPERIEEIVDLYVRAIARGETGEEAAP
jgi:TetR/AcrR family transcriptional regulator of autoinduction and epiphytic fitness